MVNEVKSMELVWIELSRSALQNNLEVLQSALPSQTQLAPCVKANAYGHGESFIVAELFRNGVEWLALNSLRERESLHTAGLDCKALIMGYVPAEETECLLDLRARPFVYDLERVYEMSRRAKQRGDVLPVHVKVDTGMTRLGVFPSEARVFIEEIAKLPSIEVEGLVTHFANSDERETSSYFEYQQGQFLEVIRDLKAHDLCPPMVHCANSAVTLVRTEEVSQTLVRPGLSLLGEYPSSEIERNSQEASGKRLKPVLTLKTRIVSVKWVEEGTYVGYDCTYRTPRRSRIAVLPMGYADGFDRGLSNQGEVLVRGQRVPVVGRVSMNMTMIDITYVPEAEIEEEVVVLGQMGEEKVSAREYAEKLETNPYEVFARLRESLPKFWVE